MLCGVRRIDPRRFDFSGRSDAITKTIKLSPRLAAIASWVPRGARLADIGTDHAYLPAWLVQNGVVNQAIAADVLPGPLANAHETISGCGAGGRIQTVLSDGLKKIDLSGIDWVVIAGMGGETISKILADAPAGRDPRLRYVLQPMTRAEKLRLFLYQNGYEITEEKVVTEDARLYLLIACQYTGHKTAPDLFQVHIGRLAENPDAAALAWLHKVSRRLKKAEKGLSAAGDSVAGKQGERMETQWLIARLEQIFAEERENSDAHGERYL